MIAPLRTLVLAAAASTAMVFATPDQAAAGDFSIGVGIHIGSRHRGHGHGHYHHRRARYYPPPHRVVYRAPVVYAPPPVVVHRVYVPGHYVNRTVRVQVREGYTTRQWVPPVYQTRRDDFGNEYKVLVREGHYTEVSNPPVYEERTERVWIPGHYQ